MIADTSDIHELGVAQQGHAEDLAAVAADLRAATVAAGTFGTVGAGFVAALNDALAQETRRVTELAERLATARRVAGAAAEAYSVAEGHAGQTISRLAT